MAVPRNDLESLTEDGLHEVWVNDLERRTLADDPAVGDRDDARRESRGEIQVVEHRTDRELPTRREVAKKCERRELMPGVEVDRRLIEKKHRCVLREGHRKNGALPLAAGKPIDPARGQRTELELAERAIDRGDLVR